MKNRVLVGCIAIIVSSCVNSQGKETGLVGTCEGCEAVFEYGDRELAPTAILPGFEEASKKLKLSGTIYQPDGETPAEGVILYIHHTNAGGIYPTRGDEEGWAKRHGYLRGWIKTGKDGKYTFYTQVPGTYPNRSEPAHIHPYILEPDGRYYWIDSYFFEGDPLLKTNHLAKDSRGGTLGVLQLKKEGELLTATRDFFLGKNIPGYE